MFRNLRALGEKIFFRCSTLQVFVGIAEGDLVIRALKGEFHF